MKDSKGACGGVPTLSRRQMLKVLGLSVPATALALGARTSSAAPSVGSRDRALSTRVIAFRHTHTDEKLEVAYWRAGRYDRAALEEVDRLLRDFRTDEVHPIEPGLLDALHGLQHALDHRAPFHVISGYRSPDTNEMLRKTGGGGVARRSLHMEGRAIDVRLPGVPTARLREAAVALGAGGVGYYPDSDFVHLDTGRVRSW